MSEHVAASLYERIGAEHFGVVAEWLRDVASEHAVEWDAKVHPPSVSWLAEAVSFYEPGEGAA